MRDFPPVQVSLGVKGDVSYTCETASHFFLYQVAARWEEFTAKLRTITNKVSTMHHTPFGVM